MVQSVDGSRPIRSQASSTPRPCWTSARQKSSPASWTFAGPPYVVQPSPCSATSRKPRGPCAAITRAGGEPRRSVLLGYGPDRPLESVAAFEDKVERARAAGFDELVVYWPDREGSDFASDPDVLLEGLSRVADL